VGYGREAMVHLIDRIHGLSDDEHRRIYISFEPENEIAKSLYESLGFMPDGRILYGEVVYFLEL
jgi:diamine N-acetyltransferase